MLVKAIENFSTQVRPRVMHIDYDFSSMRAAFSRGGMVSPLDAKAGDPLCVKLPCWRANAQITPLAHYMQVLSFEAKEKMERVFHTNENRAFAGVEVLLGAVAATPDLVFKLRDCLSEHQRTSTEMVAEDSELLFIKEGVMLLNPPRARQGETLADEFKQFPGVEERYCTLVLPRSRSHHEKFEEMVLLEQLLCFANIYTQARWPDAGMSWAL